MVRKLGSHVWWIFLLLHIIVVCSQRSRDLAREEIDNLNKYIANVNELQEEENLLNFGGAVIDSGQVEDDAIRTACDTEMNIPLQLPYDLDRYRDDVTQFVSLWNKCLRLWNNRQANVDWDYYTDLTDENSQKKQTVSRAFSSWQRVLTGKTKQIMNSVNYQDLDPDLKRQIRLLGFTTSLKDPEEQSEFSENADRMKKIYSTATVDGLTLDPDLNTIMERSRDPDALLGAWWGWRTQTGPQLKDLYTKNIHLLNKGAVDNGFNDYAEAWIDDQFEDTSDLEEMAEQYWREIEPFYKQLHAYVRYKLTEYYADYNPSRAEYGFSDILKDGAIPAHLLGNMWAQDWEQIFDIIQPYPDVTEPDYDAVMLDQNYDTNKMFTMAEEFYTSIGLFPMSSTFNKKSMKTRPNDRDVVCHASAFDFYTVKPEVDVRIKMCTKVNFENFRTVHHEMGHIEYFMAYQDQPTVYRYSPNSAFHEALGDTIAISVDSRKHLRTIGLDTTPAEPSNQHTPSKGTINFLIKTALSKITFLPFGYMMDKWRFDVFRGRVTQDKYNKHWWDLRLKYQGLVSPVSRNEDDFDPGAKFHIASNSPYICYFFGFLAEFQFYEALCHESGHTGPLFECDFYNSKEAGIKLLSMMSLGRSKHWTEAMEVLTNTTKFSTSSILKYFQPLHDWLIEENKRLQNKVGWKYASINWKE